MFREERTSYQFAWKDLGNIGEGRPNLGPKVGVAVYRLMQYTLRDVMITKLGVKKADEIIFEAGRLAGMEFCKNVLNTRLDFYAFIADLTVKLASLDIGVLRVETADLDKMQFTLTVSEDLDCSGLPVTGESVCTYDEGFVSGILHAYTKKEFDVKEIDSWATGGRTCRFRAAMIS